MTVYPVNFKQLLCIGLLMIGSPVCLWAEDRQALEDSMFNSTEGMIQTNQDQTATNPSASEKNTVGFSGEITSAVADIISSSIAANALYTYTVGNMLLDARLSRGAKVFANLEATIFSQTKTTDVALRELFLDFNLGQTVYFRAGKQVLQWGRCYLWNPTDLINVERKPFIRKIGYREGAYGIKFHVPSGTAFNLYGFIDTDTALTAESTASALKTEFLISNFEMAFSGWAKKGYHPVWGYDFSTRIFGIDTFGEVSVSQGENQTRMVLENDQLALAQDSSRWTPRACLDFSKGFRVGNFDDRLRVTCEVYYDQTGISDTAFADTNIYAFQQPVMQFSADGQGTLVMAGTKKDFINFYRLHEMNRFSPWYTAVFTTFSRFILTDMTLSGNYIRNILDQSSLLSAGLNYTELNGFSAGLLVNTYFGEPNREYTYNNEKYNIQFTLGITF